VHAPTRFSKNLFFCHLFFRSLSIPENVYHLTRKNMKLNNKTLARIVEMIEQDCFGIAEICKMAGIAAKTFYDWKKTKLAFSEAVEEAFGRRDEALVAAARIGLKQFEQTEERITCVPQKNNPDTEVEKCRVVKKKRCPPNLQAIKYVPEHNSRGKTTAGNRLQLVVEVQDEEAMRRWEAFADATAPPGFCPKWEGKATPAEPQQATRAEAHHNEPDSAPAAVKASKPEAKPMSEKLRRALQPVESVLLPPGYLRRGVRT
jgi:transposase-like protein